MLNYLGRILAWIQRFLRCIESLGFINTIKICIVGRLLKKEISLKLPDGNRFYFHGSKDMVTSHFYNRGYYIYTGPSSKIEFIIDGGANIGVETARFSIHYPDAQIISIEANSRNFNFLQKNFANSLHIKTIEAGLWPIKTQLKVESTSEDMQAFAVSATDNSDGSISAITIPEIMEKYKINQIDILKLDIEGAELPLFTSGDTSWIEKVNVFIIEIGDQDAEGMTQAIFKAVSHIKFNAYLCGENIVLIKSELTWKLQKVFGFA